MRKLVYSTSSYSMAISTLRPETPRWVVPDEELHRHFNDVERKIDTLLYGRRMYEIMAGYWPTADQETHTFSSGTVLLRCAPVTP